MLTDGQRHAIIRPFFLSKRAYKMSLDSALYTYYIYFDSFLFHMRGNIKQ